jgi:hypothetical protein
MRKTALILCMPLCLLIFTARAHAQNILSNGTAIGIPIRAKVQNGDIITSTTNGYKLSDSPYDPQIFGVVSLNPAVYLKDSTAKNDIPVISQGQVLIRVSSQNGTIAAGDYITSSTIPGIGEKATDNGYVLGQTTQAYQSNDPKKVGEILVTLQPHYQQLTNNITHNIYSSFSFGLSEAVNSPLGAIRYFIAGIITLLSFYFGFRFFARASNRGVEAIGRNPLARQAILTSVFFNTVITIAIMFFGVAISYLILVL